MARHKITPNKMRKLQAILLFQFIITGFCFAQISADELLDFKYTSFTIADGFENICLIDKNVKQDTLAIHVFAQFDCHKLVAFVSIDEDTLKLFCNNDYTEKSETYFDEKTGKYMTGITMRQPICCGKCGFILRFKLSPEYQNVPLLFNNKMIENCGNRTQYELIQTDTINRIDKLGLRQGAWMTFHDNGELATLDTFRNDQILIGYKFDYSGKTIAKTTWDGYQTITFESLTDTTIFKELLYAPKINRKRKDE